MNKKTCAFLLALSVGLSATNALAAPASNSKPVQCYKYSDKIPPGEAMPGEYKTILSYEVKCGTTMHIFTLRAQAGHRLPMNIEQLKGGAWVVIAREVYDPTVKYGSGQFRVKLDNIKGTKPVSYRGSFTVPL